MKIMNEKIININRLINMLVDMLRVSAPYIYYISYTNDFILYDNNLNIISYDERDVKIKVNSIKYVVKENTIYINIDLLEDMFKTYVLVIRTMRGAYQINQAIRYEKGQDCAYNAHMFHFIYFHCLYNEKAHDFSKQNTTENIDKFAFIKVMVKHIFDVNLDFDNLDKQNYDPIFKEMEKQYTKDLVIKYVVKHQFNRNIF